MEHCRAKELQTASNRVNGVVIHDLANPAHPNVTSPFNQELTLGVRNSFATNDYLYAISGGQKYVISIRFAGGRSGELIGNLADQNREIALFKPYEPDACTQNAPLVTNPMP